MNHKEKEYIRECLKVFDSFIASNPKSAILLLKFGATLDEIRTVRLYWDSIISYIADQGTTNTEYLAHFRKRVDQLLGSN